MDALPIDRGDRPALRLARRPARCTPAATTATPRCCSAPRRYLAETRNFDGTVAVIFQPAEEGGGGGQRDGRGRADGALRHRGGLRHAQHARRCRSASSRSAPGPIMAATDEFTITVTGRGGHAAHAAPRDRPDRRRQRSIVLALQTIVSRNVDPLEAGGGLGDQVPRRRRLQRHPRARSSSRGTVRTLDAGDRSDLIEARMRAIVDGIAAAYGADGRRRLPAATIRSPSTHAAETAFAGRRRRRGRRRRPASTPRAPPVMGGEDFSFMLNARPGAFIFIGNGDTRRPPPPGLRLQRRG